MAATPPIDASYDGDKTPRSSDGRTGKLSGRRIGFYTSVVGKGGSEFITADTMEAVYQAGAEVICWSDQDAAIREITAANSGRLRVEHRTWPPASPAVEGGPSVSPPPAPGIEGVLRHSWRKVFPLAVKRYVGFHRQARSFAQELGPAGLDLLFVNVNGSEAASLAGLKAGNLVVNCYHVAYSPPGGDWMMRLGDERVRRQCLFSGDLNLFVSQSIRDQWCNRFAYPGGSARVIYNGIDPPAVADREAIRRDLGLSRDAFVICVPARIDPVKGHRYLVEAVRLVAGRLPGIICLICGDGPIRAEVEAQVEADGLTEVIWFLGWRNDVGSILQGSDAVALPSISEPFGLAVIEGMLMGLPAVATAVGGMVETIIDGKTGYLVPPGDPPALAAAFERLVGDPQAARRMGEAAAADIRERFTRRRMMDDYVEAIAEILGRA